MNQISILLLLGLSFTATESNAIHIHSNSHIHSHSANTIWRELPFENADEDDPDKVMNNMRIDAGEDMGELSKQAGDGIYSPDM